MTRAAALFALLLLTACTSEWDMHGVDPKDYYAAHPKINTVKTQDVSYEVEFAHGNDRLLSDEIDALRSQLQGVRPEAAQSVQVQLPKYQMRNESRKMHLSKLLRNLGYAKNKVMFEPSDTLDKNAARITIIYAVVVSPPDCPDWRMSPVSTFSNTHQGNFGCAATTNLGLMVADPRDLVRGEGDGLMDTQRNIQVIQDYHSGKDFGAPDNSAASSAMKAVTPSQGQPAGSGSQ